VEDLQGLYSSGFVQRLRLEGVASVVAWRPSRLTPHSGLGIVTTDASPHDLASVASLDSLTTDVDSRLPMPTRLTDIEASIKW